MLFFYSYYFILNIMSCVLVPTLCITYKFNTYNCINQVICPIRYRKPIMSGDIGFLMWVVFNFCLFATSCGICKILYTYKTTYLYICVTFPSSDKYYQLVGLIPILQTNRHQKVALPKMV